ncbi:MAG: RNA 2',3'-cyclic phosphodiesterase [Candidatus Omnitrophica bacterium]|nr:RNA 2',3'-cyclic phosphodiesterase [Candidatus Omnitrophota bacterium]
MRCFIAICLPEKVREGLTQLQHQLKQARADVKWVESGALHVTLHFLGEINAEECRQVEGMLRQIAVGCAPFTLKLQGIGAFPNLEKPRVLWVDIAEGKKALEELASSIAREGQALGFSTEKRPFAAHVTIGRVRSGLNLKSLALRMRQSVWAAPAAWQADYVYLFQSVLSSLGPTYTVLAEIPLGRMVHS